MSVYVAVVWATCNRILPGIIMIKSSKMDIIREIRHRFKISFSENFLKLYGTDNSNKTLTLGPRLQNETGVECVDYKIKKCWFV